ncbi:MAG TPA: tetratricopeptide repeat protein [Chitinophagaceae bacterium]
MQTNFAAFAQNKVYDADDLVKKLSIDDGAVLSGVWDVYNYLKGKDSSVAMSFLNDLERKTGSHNGYFKSRFFLTKALWLWNTKQPSLVEQVEALMKQALNAAYEINNDSLISEIAWQLNSKMYYSSRIEASVMYGLYAAETDEKIGRDISATRCGFLGDVLYAAHDYEKSIYYTKLAIQKCQDKSTSIVMSSYNTIALCCQKTGSYDSAFYYFNIARGLAIKLDNKIWQSIISGNEGQVYYMQQQYAMAKPLLESDYLFSKAYGEFGSASNSLQWVARINLIEGKKDSALMQVREAMQLLQEDFNANYFQNILYATTDVYRAFGSSDSVYKYSRLYTRVHDSIERAAAISSLEIARIKLDNLQNIVAIRNLQSEKEQVKQQRNFIVAAIVMLSIIVLLILNWQRQKLKFKQQLVLQEKAAEIAAAKEQLQLFTRNIVEKTNLIEALQLQLQHRELNKQQHQIIEELSNFTIITEEQWNKFKSLYEKIYPGFFAKLKLRAHDITIAEQRMAALTHLQFTNSQVASMLGISADSVRKTRLRLRQRLNLPSYTSLEEWIAAI